MPHTHSYGGYDDDEGRGHDSGTTLVIKVVHAVVMEVMNKGGHRGWWCMVMNQGGIRDDEGSRGDKLR